MTLSTRWRRHSTKVNIYRRGWTRTVGLTPGSISVCPRQRAGSCANGWLRGGTSTTQGQGQLWITENNQQYGGGACRIFTHIESQSQLLPQGSFVTKGTPLNATVGHSVFRHTTTTTTMPDHAGTNDFGSWLFYGEVWNNQHQTATIRLQDTGSVSAPTTVTSTPTRSR